MLHAKDVFSRGRTGADTVEQCVFIHRVYIRRRLSLQSRLVRDRPVDPGGRGRVEEMEEEEMEEMEEEEKRGGG